MYDINIYKWPFKPQAMVKLLRKRYADSGKGRGWRVNLHLPKRKRKRNLLGRLRTSWSKRGTPPSRASQNRGRRRNSFLERIPS